MNGRQHQMMGASAGLATYAAWCMISSSQPSLIPGALSIASTTFGSLFPDIDHPRTKLRRYFNTICLGGALVMPVINKFQIIYAIPPLVLYAVVRWSPMFKHRGITHEVMTYIFLIAFLGLNVVGFSFVTGCYIHLVGDMMTKRGCTIFGRRCNIMKLSSKSPYLDVVATSLSFLNVVVGVLMFALWVN